MYVDPNYMDWTPEEYKERLHHPKSKRRVIPASKNYLKPHKGDDNIWYFDTKVFNIYGLGRFYIGLANHIKILNCPQLKDFAKEFANKHLL